MGGRGRGKKTSTGTAAHAIAHALGINKNEIIAYANQRTIEDPADFPVVHRALIPLELSNELQYISELKLELVNRFNESPFFLDNIQVRDIRRYTDKYNEIQREKLDLDFSLLPEELCWRSEQVVNPPTKKSKVDCESSEVIQQKLMRLEQAEKQDDSVNEVEDESGSDDSEEPQGSVCASDDDFEEDNDYCATYFDNGEGYGDLGMGIKDLSKVIADNAPNAIKLNDMKSYFGRKVAIDASMCLYQFLIAVRQDGSQLQSESGETTSHLMGMFYRTIRMIDNGVKPCYVFDGKPPDMKAGELEKRTERRAEAEKALNVAKEKGDSEAVDKFERRLVKVTKEQNEDVKILLRLMGVPVIEAPCEAEAQCAALVKANKVFASATEDMDALTFGSNVLLRHMTFSEAKKVPIKEICLSRVLTDFDMTMEQFIDLCILLGCDYCESIRGIGPKKAFELIKAYGDIESILENLDQKKFPPPSNWPYQRARELFLNPEIADCENITVEFSLY
ncbi:XPG protein [Dictyocaulus viviparus]|uniref:Flap endonuclease 1 n=1 Tax=Dictyocaulus viviparus TaxID=29172 RepID=A0A0D8Y9W1_DICVI|nr:XPG protein [Dictyocaulus viviparus]